VAVVQVARVVPGAWVVWVEVALQEEMQRPWRSGPVVAAVMDAVAATAVLAVVAEVVQALEFGSKVQLDP
jgi:hypothetical protein